LIPFYWYWPVAGALWQVILHSLIAAGILSTWARRLRVPSGRAKRWILCTLLILPPITAFVPGRNSFDFREGAAWLDSARILAIPLADDVRIYDLVLVVVAITTLVSIWQEILPALRRPRPDFDDIPEWLIRRVRTLPAWQDCRVGITPDGAIFLGTAGRWLRPRLILSRGALEKLTNEEFEAALLHENAHWHRGRWLIPRLLFIVRMLQCFNPVALWAFRTYAIEVEIDCDAEAAAGQNPRHLARGLLKVYESTDRRDLATRSTLRTRVDLLLGRAERADGRLEPTTVLFAGLILALILPWIV
jgi:hypothetical protein